MLTNQQREDVVETGDELLCTKFAAAQVGVSVTYFRLLAAQTPPIRPRVLKGSALLSWTNEQVAEIAKRKKR